MGRRNDYFNGLISERSVRSTPVDIGSGASIPRRKPRKGSGMYENWFLQDVAQSLPFGHGPEKAFHLTLMPQDPVVEELVLNALPSRSHGGLPEGFRYFLQTATFDLVKARLFLDLEYFYRTKDRNGPPAAFRVHVLPAKSVVKGFRNYSQTVSMDGSENWSKQRLDHKNLVVISLPRQVAKHARDAVALLGQASSQASVATDFVTGEHGSNTGFELEAYGELLNDLVLKGTRAIGWAGRNTFLDGMLDPEKAWRAIQFARFQIAVRDAALNGLQEAVDRAGSEIGFSTKLKLSGVLTSADLDGMETQLHQGTRPITELFHPMLRSSGVGRD